MDIKIKNSGGYVVMISVIILAAIGTTIAVSMLLLGLNAGTNALSTEQAIRSNALAEACMERALYSLKLDAGYSGNEELNFTTGSCQILEIQNDSGTYLIKTRAQNGNAVRKIRASVQMAQPQNILQVNYAQEVADF